MTTKPTYEELEQRIARLEAELARTQSVDKAVIRTLSEDFAQLADRSQDAIYRFDIETRTFTFFNKLFLEHFHIIANGRRILTERGAFSHIHEEDRPRFLAARNDSLKGGRQSGEMEYRYLASDGTVRWMHSKWTIIRDRHGKATAIEGFIRDNSLRKQAEHEFEQSIHNSLIGCYIVQDARFVYVNPEFTRITGYSKEELLGTPPLNLVQEPFRAQVRENFIQMLKGQRDYPYEFRVVKKSGTIRWIAETATSVQYRESRAGLGYFMDITRSKEAEEQQREKEKLQAILEMAGAISHELNSPLQVVLTCSEKLATDTLTDQLRIRLRKLLRENVTKMTDISAKIQNITQYTTKEYVQGKKIIDIHKSAQGKQTKLSLDQ
jgi:PAS domain S-box-containing protein